MPDIQGPWWGSVFSKALSKALNIFRHRLLNKKPIGTLTVAGGWQNMIARGGWGPNCFRLLMHNTIAATLEDLHPDVISCFQRLVPERWLSSRKIRWIKLTIKPKSHIKDVTKHLFWRRWIDQFWSLTKHVLYDSLHKLTPKLCSKP